MSVTRLADKSIQGTSVQVVVDDIALAQKEEKIAAIMVCWLDHDGCWNFQRSAVPSCTRAIGALEQLKFNFLAD